MKLARALAGWGFVLTLHPTPSATHTHSSQSLSPLPSCSGLVAACSRARAGAGSQPAAHSQAHGSISRCCPFQTQFPCLGRKLNHTPPPGTSESLWKKEKVYGVKGCPSGGFSWGPRVLKSRSRAKPIAASKTDNSPERLGQGRA